MRRGRLLVTVERAARMLGAMSTGAAGTAGHGTGDARARAGVSATDEGAASQRNAACASIKQDECTTRASGRWEPSQQVVQRLAQAPLATLTSLEIQDSLPPGGKVATPLLDPASDVKVAGGLPIRLRVRPADG